MYKEISLELLIGLAHLGVAILCVNVSWYPQAILNAIAAGVFLGIAISEF